MNHARWQANFADKRKTTEIDGAEAADLIETGSTPAITKKLLEMDEKQLDLLTGQRGEIFKSDGALSMVSRSNTLPDQVAEDANETERGPHDPLGGQ